MDPNENRAAEPGGDETATGMSPSAVAGNAAVLLARESINYVSYYFRVPVVVCFFAMAVVVAIVIQDAYPRAHAYLAAAMGPLLARLPGEVHLDNSSWIKIYGVISTAMYVLGLVGRLALRGRTPTLTYRSKFAVAAAVATLGWGFVLLNLPYMRVAAGTSRMGLGLVFLCFYALTLAAFAAALALSWFADAVSAAGGRLVERHAER